MLFPNGITKTKSFPESGVCDVILIPMDALGSMNIRKRKNSKLIERFVGIRDSFDAFSQNPSRYAIMVVSSKIAGPPSFDIMRQIKGVNPYIKVIIAADEDNDDDGKNFENLPFVDSITHSSIESIDLGQISMLADSDDERAVLLAELRSFGAEIEKFQQCTVDQLHGIVAGLKDLIQQTSTSEKPLLSELDKKILKEMILSKGRVSSLTLSKSLQIPLTTLQRKRKRLESEILEEKYALKYEKFGLKRIILFISTIRGRNNEVGRKLLGFKEVLVVHKSIGAHNIDLHAEVIIRDNHELVSLIEGIKSIDEIREVMWIETLKVIGTNTDAIIRIFKD